jgi:hypothetical protein
MIFLPGAQIRPVLLRIPVIRNTNGKKMPWRLSCCPPAFPHLKTIRMKTFTRARHLALIGGVILSATAFAQPTTYIGAGNSGPNATTYSFVATGSGDVTAYFVGHTAGYISVVGMSVNGDPVSIFGLPNHTSFQGEPLVLGSVDSGDVIDFVLQVTQLPISDPGQLYLVFKCAPELGWTKSHILQRVCGRSDNPGRHIRWLRGSP